MFMSISNKNIFDIFTILKIKYNFHLSQLYAYYLSKFIHIQNKASISYPLFLVGGKYIQIGKSFNCFPRLRLEAHSTHNGFTFTPSIIIGDNVSINYDCHIGAINQISIGDNVLIGSKVCIIDHFHGKITMDELKTPPSERKLYSKGPIIIKNNVWIGEGAVILPNVQIGENVIVGANSVVTKDIPANCVVGGNPAR